MQEQPVILIEITGGNAEITLKPAGIRVIIWDWDNYNANHGHYPPGTAPQNHYEPWDAPAEEELRLTAAGIHFERDDATPLVAYLRETGALN